MKNLLLGLLLLGSLPAFAQKYPRGLPDEPDTLYTEIAQKAILTTALYRDIGTKHSLKQYAPYPGWQDYGTCAAFATAYAARTIIEAQQNNWTDRKKITENAFAPGFIYKITNAENAKCWGSYTRDLLNNMVRYGVPKQTDFPAECPASYPPKSIFDKAINHKIKGFVRLFDEDDAPKTKINTVKKSISEGNPVVISMICPKSFDDVSGVWNPTEHPNESIMGRKHGRHAICVVGYDDEKHGGAFEILNSWGKGWGNDGFIWIRYSDFSKFIYQGFEVLNIGGQPPAPTPNPEPISYNFDGELRIVDTENNAISVSLVSGSNRYRLSSPLSSGSRFRLYLKNTQPAFVYLIGWDNSNAVFQMFPYKPSISPALTYSKNEVALPSEDQHIRLDNTAGKDVMALIYSKKELDIKNIMSNLKSTSIPMDKKLMQLIGTDLVLPENTKYEPNNIRFKAKEVKQSTIVSFIEIEHQ